MFRQYEDPWKLEQQLKEKEKDMETMKNRGYDMEDLIDIQLEIEDLKERINFAWQDDEYDEMNADAPFQHEDMYLQYEPCDANGIYY